MVFQADTYSVLLVSASQKFNTAMLPLLPGTDYYPVITVGSAGEAQRRRLERSFDLVIVNAPLPDEFGLQLAMDACADSEAGVLLLVKSDLYEELYYKAVSCGVVTLPKPTNAQILTQTTRMLCATRERLRRLEQKQLSVEEKIEEMRLVNRAKWRLIETLHMSEADAHQHIHRLAMDKRITKREAAEDILRTYAGRS